MTKSDIPKIVETAFRAIEVIDKLLTGGKHEAKIDAITAVVSAVKDGFEGKTAPDVVLAELDSLTKQISANDAAADAALRAKFPEGDS